jgi:hypothetical protein
MNLFFGIVLSFLTIHSAHAAIEIISAGRRFDSFEDYQKIEKKKAEAMEHLAKGEPIPEPPDPSQQKLKKTSYNGGVHRVMVGFGQDWQNPKPRFIVDAMELEYSIQEALENQNDPALLISDSKKLRIMSYSPQVVASNQVDKPVKK